jgi:GT2 family glycosyltransferase
MPRKIRLVCATRDSKERFLAESMLGRSLTLLKRVRPIQVRLFSQNSAGLPTVYNAAIDEAVRDPAILVFIHDDVSICDYFWAEKVEAALQQFDVVGLAGNKRRVPRQPGWAFVRRDPGKFVWDERANLSGVVGHGTGFPCKDLSVYGPPGAACKLLDGLMLIADSATLAAAQLRFDPRFTFHLYDVDFCRQAELKNLRMGTWPISVVHQSGGNFSSKGWAAGYRAYLEKYGEAA